MAESISFARGAPSLDIVDVAGLREAAARAFEADPGGMTAYGTSVGYPPLREWIAERHGVKPENVIVTNGSMQADAFLFDTLVSPGDSVIVERPTYDRTLLSLRQRGADVRMVELEEDGIDVAAVERVLAAGASPKLAHIIPNFQNPAGYTLSAAKRERLLELAAERDFWIFEDDPYRLIRFGDAELPPTMLSADSSGHVIHASSFSKTVSPGVRVGYLAGPTEEIQTLAKRGSEHYISPNMLAESMVLELCRSGALAENIEVVNAALAERRDALVEALGELIPEARFVVPGGGYFLWLDLDDDVDSPSLLEAAKGEGVAFVAGPDFMLEGGRSSLRLSFASVPADQVAEGVGRLARALESQRAASPA